ncbi:cytochrome P450 [Aldersonia kunmingensis]|uniref:cytochrome P450 n=1 Tax=Aldersonia kunmingensis TaxID=408066 RepID=UPI00082A6A56|nr:cytochrome P450 [Aldersonia kunmingensis]
MTIELKEPPLLSGPRLLGPLRELRRDPLGIGLRAYREAGDVARVSIGPPGRRIEFYGLYHPDGAAGILDAADAHNFRKESTTYDEMRNIFGNGLVTSQDEDWLRQKRFVQPLFTTKRVDGYAATMSDEIERYIASLRARSSETVNLSSEMTGLTLPLAVRILFGDDADRILPVLGAEFPLLSDATIKRGFSPMRTPLGWPTPLNVRTRRAREKIFRICDEIVDRRRASGIGSDDLVGRLIDARDGSESLSDSEVRDQILIFLFAGQDTTSIALTFALWLLGRHPEIQQQVRDEADRVLTGQTPTAEDVRALGYTTMVLKEATRLYPPVPYVARKAVEERELCGYRIPAGSDVATSAWVIHRRPDLFEDPETFDPDRFLPAREKAMHKYAWFPFGHGPRGCIGQHFAMLEAALALGRLVQEFEFRTPPGDPQLRSGITVMPVTPVLGQVTARC